MTWHQSSSSGSRLETGLMIIKYIICAKTWIVRWSKKKKKKKEDWNWSSFKFNHKRYETVLIFKTLTSTSQVKSVPSNRLTRQTTSFILPFFTSRRGDGKMEVWPSSPVPCSPSAAPSGSFLSSPVACSSFVTLASSGPASAPSSSFSSFFGWRSLCGKIKADVSL